MGGRLSSKGTARIFSHWLLQGKPGDGRFDDLTILPAAIWQESRIRGSCACQRLGFRRPSWSQCLRDYIHIMTQGMLFGRYARFNLRTTLRTTLPIKDLVEMTLQVPKKAM